MKTFYLLAIAAMFAKSANSQMIFPVNSDGKISYDSIVTVPDSATVLFNKAQSWFASAFNDSKSVIQVADKDAGKIIGKGIIETGDGYIDFQITVMVKSGKYKYSVNSFMKYLNSINSEYAMEQFLKSDHTVKGVLAGESKRINGSIRAMIASLNEAMNKQEEKW